MDTLEETYVAFSIVQMDASRVVMILGAFDVEAAFSDWELVASFPTALVVLMMARSAIASWAAEPAFLSTLNRRPHTRKHAIADA